MSAPTDSYRPRAVLQKAYRNWWVVAACLVLGGLAGLLVHALRPTVYEATFSIPTTMDLTNLGETTQFEEDLSMEVVGYLLYNPDLWSRLSSAASAQGLTLTPDQVRAATRVERRLGTWTARADLRDAKQAEALATLWLKTAADDLEAARKHALNADALQRKELSTEACLAAAPSREPAAGTCAPGDEAALEAQLNAFSAAIARERSASHGLSSGVIFDTALARVSPVQAVASQRGQSALAGALIGLVLGVWLSQSAWIEKRLRRHA